MKWSEPVITTNYIGLYTKENIHNPKIIFWKAKGIYTICKPYSQREDGEQNLSSQGPEILQYSYTFHFSYLTMKEGNSHYSVHPLTIAHFMVNCDNTKFLNNFPSDTLLPLSTNCYIVR